MEELRSLRAQYDSSVAETKKVRKPFLFTSFQVLEVCSCEAVSLSSLVLVVQLREELQRARQTHSGELDGMREEVSRLTAELHQRDVAIASLDGSSSAIRQQLRSEAAQVERKEAELNVRREPEENV